MARPKVEWDPSWDEDWESEMGKLEEEMEDEHPRSPEEAVKLYRYGYSAARRHPMHEWSDVESELYQDYMTGAPEPGEPGSTNMAWEQATDWVQRGWRAGHSYKT